MKTQTLAGCFRATHFAVILGLAWAPPAQASTFGGRAFAAFVNTLATGPLYLSDSGELAPNGGWAGAGLLGAEVPGVLSAHVLNAATSGAEYAAGDKAHSSSSLADVVLLPGHLAEVTASFVRAQVNATTMGSGGGPEIADLTLGGFPVTVTGLPNQSVQIPGVATLIINEQAVTTDGVSHEITLNALRLTLVTGEEVILASVRSRVNPAGQVILTPPANITPPSLPNTPIAPPVTPPVTPPLDVPLLPPPVITPPLATPAPTPTNITPLAIVGSPSIKRGQLHSGSSNGPLVKDWNKSQDNCPSYTDQVRNVVWRSTARPPIIMASHQKRCSPFDFVTGGGVFQPREPGGAPKPVSFGFTVGFDDDDDEGPRVEGHFTLRDRNDGTRIKILSVDSYEPLSEDPDHCRIFGGTAKVTGPVSGTFPYTVGVCDYGGHREHDEDDDDKDDDDDGASGPDDTIRVKVCPSSPCTVAPVEQGDILYHADNRDPAKTCPAGKPFCGDLDRGDIQLRTSKCKAGQTASRQWRETLPLEL